MQRALKAKVRKQFDVKPLRSKSALPYPRKCKRDTNLGILSLHFVYGINNSYFSDCIEIFPSFERNYLLIKAFYFGDSELEILTGFLEFSC